MVTFGAYFDDSGSHDNSQLVVVGGYISTPARWETFDREWRSAISDFGLRERFHASDCATGAPPFDSWTLEQRKLRPVELISIINRHALLGVSVTIKRSEYNDCIEDSHRSRLGGPYGLAALTCGTEVFKAMRDTHPDARAAFFYDAGTRGRGEVLKVFDEGLRRSGDTKDNHFRVASMSFVDSRKNTPIQAADILAYEMYRGMASRFGLTDRPIRRAITAELSKIPHLWRVLLPENLKGIATMLEQGPLSIELPQIKPQKKRGPK